jgi:hypothetical protein
MLIHIRFCVFVILVSKAIAPPLVALEGVHWARDGTKFVCRANGCNMATKYNMVCHLWAHHNVIMELGKPECPSTWEEGPTHQDHATMNAQVLSNPLAHFCHKGTKGNCKGQKACKLKVG